MTQQSWQVLNILMYLQMHRQDNNTSQSLSDSKAREMRTDGVMRTVDLSKLFNMISLLVYQNEAFCNKETTQSQEWFKNYGMVGNSHVPISLYSHKVKRQHQQHPYLMFSKLPVYLPIAVHLKTCDYN